MFRTTIGTKFSSVAHFANICGTVESLQTFFGWDAAAICFQQTSCDGTSVKQSANRAQIHRNGFKLDQNSANKTEEVVHEFKLAQVSLKPM